MEVHIATPAEIAKLSRLSISLGNIPFAEDQAIVAVLEHETKDQKKEIVGFAAVQTALHAAGSWVKEEYRGKRHSYELRACLDNELRNRGYGVYFALPGNDFEKALFAKYGHVIEHAAQIRHL